MEEQGRHRRKLETIVVRGDDRREDKGQNYGFILCMTVVIGGIVLLALGINIAGYIALIGGLGIPAGLFVYKKLEAKKELRDKKKKLQAESNNQQIARRR
jgi:Flp pilus assembly protein TadB